MKNRQSQNDSLKNWLANGKKINTFLAFKKFGITSLHRRLTDLRNSGINIISEWNDPKIKDFKHYRCD